MPAPGQIPLCHIVPGKEGGSYRLRVGKEGCEKHKKPDAGAKEGKGMRSKATRKAQQDLKKGRPVPAWEKMTDKGGWLGGWQEKSRKWTMEVSWDVRRCAGRRGFWMPAGLPDIRGKIRQGVAGGQAGPRLSFCRLFAAKGCLVNLRSFAYILRANDAPHVL